MALSGRLYGTTSNDKISMWIDWSATQNLDENYSVLSFTLYYAKEGSYSTTGTLQSWISCYNKTNNGSRWANLHSNLTIEACSLTDVRVPHNPDGTLTINVTAGGGIGGTTFSSSSLNANIVLDQIPRQTTLASAPNFTDEQNPTITYNNPVGDYPALTSLQACISLDGSSPDIPYRDISKTGTSYTFNLTEDERNVLRRATTTSNTRTVRFYVRCILNGKTLYDNLERTLTIVNATPAITNPSAKDTNATTVALTGNNQRVVKYFSNVLASFTPTFKKYATQKSVSIKNGNTTVNATSHTFPTIENSNFTFTVSDSRSNASTLTVPLTLVEYVKLTCSLKATAPTTDGDNTLTITGNYWGGNFGAQNNTLTLQYRHQDGYSDYGEWQTVTAQVKYNGNKYEVVQPLSGFDYRNSHTFQVRAIDKLMTVTSNEHKVRTTPVFDWGENDFCFNVPVEFATSNQILWSGAYYMQGSQSIRLSQPVEQQISGITLVFSKYTGTAALDEEWHSFFVPKTLINKQDGDEHTFVMISSSNVAMCVKTLIISNNTITGKNANSFDTTFGGLPMKNTAFVLRYVIGV